MSVKIEFSEITKQANKGSMDLLGLISQNQKDDGQTVSGGMSRKSPRFGICRHTAAVGSQQTRKKYKK
jgi:hypothetical protein